jgi:hypothetical protein
VNLLDARSLGGRTARDALAGDTAWPGWANRDAKCGIFAACTAVGGTEFCAQAGTIATAITSVAITAREIVRNSELRDCSLLCIGLSSCRLK